MKPTKPARGNRRLTRTLSMKPGKHDNERQEKVPRQMRWPATCANQVNRISSGPNRCGTGTDMQAAELQEVAASSNIFGLGVADICDGGVIVTDVNLSSRAGLIGIRRDDVILAVNGVPVLGSDEFK